MDKNLVLAVIFLITAYLFYLLHKSWLKTRKEKMLADDTFRKLNSLRLWIVIISLIILSILHFFKSF